jgi:acetyl-CoA carboxylase alpha subunit
MLDAPLRNALAELRTLPSDELIALRYARFRQMGNAFFPLV